MMPEEVEFKSKLSICKCCPWQRCHNYHREYSKHCHNLPRGVPYLGTHLPVQFHWLVLHQKRIDLLQSGELNSTACPNDTGHCCVIPVTAPPHWKAWLAPVSTRTNNYVSNDCVSCCLRPYVCCLCV